MKVIIENVDTLGMDEKRVVRTCPYCKTKTTSYSFLNTVCTGCSAKYYANTDTWLNRHGHRPKNNVCEDTTK